MALLAHFIARSRTPQYHGKTVPEWFEAIAPVWNQGNYQISKDDPAVLALKQIGPDAVPYLMKLFSRKEPVKEPSWKKYQRMVRERLPVLPLPPYDEHKDLFIASRVLMEMGSSASNAVPQLILLGKAPNPQGIERFQAWNAIFILGSTHSRPEICVPFLIDGVNSSNGGRRIFSAQALSKFGSEAKPALPALRQMLKAPRPLDRGVAAEAIVKIEGPSAEMIQFMIQELPNLPASGHVVNALGYLGPKAKTALPALLQSYQSATNSGDKTFIGSAIQKIDPEAAVKAGIK